VSDITVLAGPPVSTTCGAPSAPQINIGLYCNQACGHCHVESSPKRHEAMDEQTVARCVALLAATPSIHTLDITGGAPEMSPHFRALVRGARAARPDIDIIDRCNLTVLTEPDQEVGDGTNPKPA